MKKFFEKINVTAVVLSVVFALVVGLVGWYFFLPAINLRSMGFWIYLTAILVAGAVPFINLNIDWSAVAISLKIKSAPKGKPSAKKRKSEEERRRANRVSVIAILVAIAPITVALLGMLISSPLFFSRSYAEVISITEAEFDLTKWYALSKEDPGAWFNLLITAADGTYAVTRAYRPEELAE